MHLLKEKKSLEIDKNKLNMQCEKGKSVNTNSFKQIKQKQSNLHIKKISRNLI
jgi:hypothetical protein